MSDFRPLWAIGFLAIARMNRESKMIGLPLLILTLRLYSLMRRPLQALVLLKTANLP